MLAGPIIVVWDNLNTHISASMTDLIAARDWLTVFRLPPYAHELNPVEQVWSHLKRFLANLTERNLAQLTALRPEWALRGCLPIWGGIPFPLAAPGATVDPDAVPT